MPKIYRIEHPADGNGPYDDGWSSSRPEAALDLARHFLRSHNDDAHPSPHSEGLNIGPLSVFDDSRSGFASLEALRDWFSPEERAELVETGFVLKVYSATAYHVQFGVTQLVFDRAAAKFVTDIPL